MRLELARCGGIGVELHADVERVSAEFGVGWAKAPGAAASAPKP
jgi:hypothetical protein